MKNSYLLAIVLNSCLLSSITHAETVTIDFEEFPAYTLAYTLQNQGYTFSLDSGGFAIHLHNTIDLGMGAAYDGIAILTLQQQNNKLFSLHQFDLYNLAVNDGSGTLNAELQVTGYQSDGSQVSINLYQSDAFSLIELSDFNMLEKVEFQLTGDFNPIGYAYGGYWPVTDLDNFVLTTVVPIPAAIWLFGAGLLTLIGFKKNSRN